MFEHCSIQRKIFKRKFVIIAALHFSFFYPGARNRILIRAFQHVRTDRPDIIDITAGKVNVPFSEQIMQLRCPDMHTHDPLVMLFPHHHFFCILQPCDRFASAKCNPVVIRQGCGKIIHSIRVTVYERICTLQDPWLIVFQFLILAHRSSSITLTCFKILYISLNSICKTMRFFNHFLFF